MTLTTDPRSTDGPAGRSTDGPGGKADRGIRNPEQRLRAMSHLLRVGEAVSEEIVEPLESPALVVVEASRRAIAGTQRLEDFRLRGERQVGVDGDELRRRHRSHYLGDECTPVAALRKEARVAEPLHQRDPGLGDPWGIPAGSSRLFREAIARHGGDHDVERVFRLASE